MKHFREPVKYTCTDIDKVIKVLDNVYKLCKLNGREETCELVDIITDVGHELWGVDDPGKHSQS